MEEVDTHKHTTQQNEIDLLQNTMYRYIEIIVTNNIT